MPDSPCSLDYNGSLPKAAQDEPKTTTIAEHGAQEKTPKDYAFWLIMAALLLSAFLSTLDLTSITIALPTIMQDLHGTDYIWASAAPKVGAAAFTIMCGGFAQVFGRRAVLLGTLAASAVGSALCGFARNIAMFFAGRAAQGIGNGGILAISYIIIADLVPLRERGHYIAMMAATGAFASAVGPPIGGINLPLTAMAMVSVLCFLNVKTPRDSFSAKMKRGGLIVIPSTTSVTIAMSWGGVQYPWTSWNILVPLLVGVMGLVAFCFYEFNWAREPFMPWELVSNRTTLFAYIMTFMHGVVCVNTIYYLPVYFQGSILETPIQAGVSVFGIALTTAPAGGIAGFVVSRMGKYRPTIWFGWALVVVGSGLLTLLRDDSPRSYQVGFQVVLGMGMGVLYLSLTFPVVAPLPVARSAHALALYQFVRDISQSVGFSVGTGIIQNVLKKKLPGSFLERFGAQAAYALIPYVKSLQEPMQSEVRAAYADGTRGVWIAMVAIGVVGLFCGFVTKEIKMQEVTDEAWGVEDTKRRLDDEEASTREVKEAEDEKVEGSLEPLSAMVLDAKAVEVC